MEMGEGFRGGLGVEGGRCRGDRWRWERDSGGQLGVEGGKSRGGRCRW